MEKTSRRRLGTLLVVVGIILMIYDLILTNTPIHCPAGGCPASYLWSYSVPFYIGLSLTIIGIILLIASKLAKSDTGTSP